MVANYRQDRNIQVTIYKDNIFSTPNPENLIYGYGGDESNVTRFKLLTFNQKAGEYVNKKSIATGEFSECVINNNHKVHQVDEAQTEFQRQLYQYLRLFGCIKVIIKNQDDHIQI